MKEMAFVTSLVLMTTGGVQAACPQYMGGRVLADDGTYLGRIAVPQDKDSLFNSYGVYGSPYSKTSIFNTYGVYGSASSPQSAFNPYATKPPVIQKGGKAIATLTANKTLDGAISVGKLISICRG